MTFYGLLAIFPATAAIVSLFSLFADPAKINEELSTFADVLPGGALSIIGDQIERISAQGGGTLGLAFVTSFAFALWGANAATKTLFDALNIIFGVHEERGFVRLTLHSLAFTICGVVLAVAAAAAVLVVPLVLNALGLQVSSGIGLLGLLRWPVLVGAVILALGALYRFGPSRSSRTALITRGGVIAAVAWLAGSLIYSWYVANFGTYNKTYGSLGVVIGFMIWMWLSSIVVLMGAEIDAAAKSR